MSRRLLALLLIAGLLSAAVVVDRTSGADRRRTDAAAARADLTSTGAPMPAAAPPTALGSTWYCAAGTAQAGGVAGLVVVIANAGTTSREADVTAVPNVGPSRRRHVTVPPRARVRLAVRDLVDARYAAAQVEVSGGAVAVEREVSGADGFDAGPCASTTSDRWYFAAGSTLRGADVVLALFNPFPADAAVDIDFATDSGPRRPRAVQALPVPGRSLALVRLSDVVTRRALVATRVRARSGRLVVDRIQTYDGQGDPVVGSGTDAVATTPPRGLAVSTGMSSPRPGWVFPAGRNRAGGREQVIVFNPSARDAEIDLDVTLDDPDRNGRLDPFRLSVPSGQVRAFDVDDQATLPEDVDHSIVVRSTNGVDVVAEQFLSAGPPWPRVGVAITAGSPLAARRWLFASGGSSPPGLVEQVVLQNLGDRAVSARIEPMTASEPGAPPPAPAPAASITVPAGGRRTVNLGETFPPGPLPLEVRASGPIVATRALYFAGRPGLSLAMGVPLIGAVPVAGGG